MLKGGTQTPPHVHVEKFSYRCPISRGIRASVQIDPKHVFNSASIGHSVDNCKYLLLPYPIGNLTQINKLKRCHHVESPQLKLVKFV
jgi:hypothetical protein